MEAPVEPNPELRAALGAESTAERCRNLGSYAKRAFHQWIGQLREERQLVRPDERAGVGAAHGHRLVAGPEDRRAPGLWPAVRYNFHLPSHLRRRQAARLPAH